MRLESLYYMNRLHEHELTEGWLAALVLHDKCALIAHASPRPEMFKQPTILRSVCWWLPSHLSQPNNHPADEGG